jgi:hypothetical protein
MLELRSGSGTVIFSVDASGTANMANLANITGSRSSPNAILGCDSIKAYHGGTDLSLYCVGAANSVLIQQPTASASAPVLKVQMGATPGGDAIRVFDSANNPKCGVNNAGLYWGPGLAGAANGNNKLTEWSGIGWGISQTQGGTTGTGFYVAQGGLAIMAGQTGAPAYGGGAGPMMFLGNINTAPTAAPSPAGGVLFVQGGALKYIGSSGTVTQLAPA